MTFAQRLRKLRKEDMKFYIDWVEPIKDDERIA